MCIYLYRCVHMSVCMRVCLSLHDLLPSISCQLYSSPPSLFHHSCPPFLLPIPHYHLSFTPSSHSHPPQPPYFKFMSYLSLLNQYCQASSCQVPQSWGTFSGTHGPVPWVRDARLVLCYFSFFCFFVHFFSFFYVLTCSFIFLPFLSCPFLSYFRLLLILIVPLSLFDFMFYRLAGTGHLATRCRRYDIASASYLWIRINVLNFSYILFSKCLCAIYFYL